MPPKRYKPQRRIKPKHSRLKKVLRNRFFWFGLLGLVVMIGVFYGIFFTPFLKIKNIKIEGVQKVSSDSVQEVVKEYIPKRFIFFEINNFFLVNVKEVSKEVKAAFPGIDTVVVDTLFPNKVKIIVQERGKVAIWCQQKNYTVEIAEEGQTTRSFQQCFALDNNGVVFEEKEPEQEVIIHNEEESAVLGEQVMKPEALSKLLLFQKEIDSLPLFQEVGLRVISFTVVAEERVHAKISEGWEAYLNPTENLDWQTTKLKLVLEQEIPFDKRPFLEYIDLRFGDQAYIKYRE